MRLHIYITMFALAALISTPTMAQNATGGGVVNSEMVDIGAGPFDHGDAVGETDNSVVTGIGFTGGFTATHVRFTGTLTSVQTDSWGSEADIQIRRGLSSYNWQNPGPSSAFTTFDYDFGGELTGDFAGGTDPNGSWDIEFIDTFDDGVGADSQSTNVTMFFEERAPVSDVNDTVAFSAMNVGDTRNAVGEFALASLFDLYTVTLNEAGRLSFFTDEDPTGFTGTTVDTEMAIFDSAGVLLAENDDGGNGLYSAINDLLLGAGDYTIAVAPFLTGTSFADGFVVNPGTGTGDYVLGVTLNPVPEPGTLAFLGFGCVGLLTFRRRK